MPASLYCARSNPDPDVMSEQFDYWYNIAPEVETAARQIVDAGQYDAAIFEAFRVVEAAIQKRVGSALIGQSLIKEAFEGEPPKITISPGNKRDTEAIHKLFAGALGLIRNDRGHKSVPSLPCRTFNDCMLYLGVASYLLHLLAQDRSVLPSITTLRLSGGPPHPRVHLSGEHLTAALGVEAGGQQCVITRRTDSEIEAVLPEHFSGDIVVRHAHGVTASFFCDGAALEVTKPTFPVVVEADITLFEDEAAQINCRDFVGTIVETRPAGRTYRMVFPTLGGRYKVGDFLKLSSDSYRFPGIGRRWYRDPSSGEHLVAWEGAAVASPDVVGNLKDARPVGITATPPRVTLSVNEIRTLTARSIVQVGGAYEINDLPAMATWHSRDPEKVEISDGGVVRARQLGKAHVECEWGDFAALVEIEVAHAIPGDKAAFFQGLRGMQQIAFDKDDNLFVSNQSEWVYKLAAQGGFSKVISLPIPSSYPAGITALAVGLDGTVYTNLLHKPHCLRFAPDGKGGYCNPVPFAGGHGGSRQGIALNQNGDAFVTVLTSGDTGLVIRHGTDGTETSFTVPTVVLNIASDSRGQLYLTAPREHAVRVYSEAGQFLESISYDADDSPSAIALDPEGRIILPFFHSGRVLRFTHATSEVSGELLADNLGVLGGAAFDSRGQLYIAQFDGDVIYLLR